MGATQLLNEDADMKDETNTQQELPLQKIIDKIQEIQDQQSMDYKMSGNPMAYQQAQRSIYNS